MGFFSEIKTRHRVKHGYMCWVALQAWALRHIETSGRESSRSSPLERSGAACSQNVTPQMRLPSPSPAHAEGFQSYTHVEKKRWWEQAKHQVQWVRHLSKKDWKKKKIKSEWKGHFYLFQSVWVKTGYFFCRWCAVLTWADGPFSLPPTTWDCDANSNLYTAHSDLRSTKYSSIWFKTN